MSGARDKILGANLLAWYQRERRSLPWRDNPTPYRIMLSEFMLQQTRVDTVLEYFQRFTERWPTLQDLALSEEEEVVKAWAGLGYYSRARNLHRCAVAAAQEGGVPDSVSELKKLPGIGPYTAGAIASIGFQRPVPIVDGNVERVLSRVDAISTNPRSAEGRKALWSRAEALLVREQPGDFNQGLMELGALVCTLKKPKCPECPWRESCEAHRLGIEETLPAIPKKAPPRPVYASYGLLYVNGALLLGKRPMQGILAGMWEPIGTRWTTEDRREEASTLVEVVKERTGLVVEVAGVLGEVVHVFSHRRLRARVYRLDLLSPMTSLEPRAFYSQVECAMEPTDFALSKLSQKLIAASH